MEQLLANILFSSCTIFLVAISFALIFSTARFFHFAHAAIITVSAYVTLAFSLWLGMQFLSASLSGEQGGVAYWAHIGGFAAGVIVMRVVILARRVRARRA